MNFTKLQLELAIDDFKQHCLDSFGDGTGADEQSPEEFMSVALEVYLDMGGGRSGYKIVGLQLVFKTYADRTNAGELLVAAGMNGITSQLCTARRGLLFSDEETLRSAINIIRGE